MEKSICKPLMFPSQCCCGCTSLMGAAKALLAVMIILNILGLIGAPSGDGGEMAAWVILGLLPALLYIAVLAVLLWALTRPFPEAVDTSGSPNLGIVAEMLEQSKGISPGSKAAYILAVLFAVTAVLNLILTLVNFTVLGLIVWILSVALGGHLVGVTFQAMRQKRWETVFALAPALNSGSYPAALFPVQSSVIVGSTVPSYVPLGEAQPMPAASVPVATGDHTQV